jgi:hypothetical protein
MRYQAALRPDILILPHDFPKSNFCILSACWHCGVSRVGGNDIEHPEGRL